MTTNHFADIGLVCATVYIKNIWLIKSFSFGVDILLILRILLV